MAKKLKIHTPAVDDTAPAPAPKPKSAHDRPTRRMVEGLLKDFDHIRYRDGGVAGLDHKRLWTIEDALNKAETKAVERCKDVQRLRKELAAAKTLYENKVNEIKTAVARVRALYQANGITDNLIVELNKLVKYYG